MLNTLGAESQGPTWVALAIAAVGVLGAIVSGRNKKQEAESAKALKEAASDAKQTAAEHKVLTAVIGTRDEAIRRYDEKIDAINAELKTMNRQIGQLETEVATLKARNDELSRLIDQKSIEIARLQEQLTQEKVDHQRTKDQLIIAIGERDSAMMQQEVLAAQVRKMEVEKRGMIG